MCVVSKNITKLWSIGLLWYRDLIPVGFFVPQFHRMTHPGRRGYIENSVAVFLFQSRSQRWFF